MTWTTILSHFSALSAFLPVLFGLISTWVATKLIPFLDAVAKKAEAELASTDTDTSHKFLSFLEDIAVKVSAAVVQANLPSLLTKIQSGTLNNTAAIQQEVSALLVSAKSQFISMAGEFGVEAEEISPYVTTIESLLRTELQDITEELSQNLPTGASADKAGGSGSNMGQSKR